ncbi:hypothetical protein VTJ49DRAFT_3446 [Mycothermus thermophilus]|uniref:Uncharacterized protein n=1 Tax=Humicola insolens TaxID=85995 RepID=A0ABR3V7W5_HUMIN
MPNFDPSISNGTCYRASDDLSADIFIPCGNSAFGHISCCQAGDKCLEHGACYNNHYRTTYLAGCTDPLYKDASCPDKKSYKAGDRIPDVGWLPTELGGRINWLAGHGPTATVPTSATSMPTSTTLSSASSEVTNITQDPQQQLSNQGLSDSQIAGIGIGAAAGALLLFGALCGLWIVCRRRRNGKDTTASQEPEEAAVQDPAINKPSGARPAEIPGTLETQSPVELPVPPVNTMPENHSHGAPAGHSHGSWLATPPPVSPMSASWKAFSSIPAWG